MSEKKIELIPVKGTRGERDIMVDGVRWGTAHMQSLGGPYGIKYWFSEGRGAPICVPSSSHWKGSNRRSTSEVNVYGDKMAKRHYNDDRPLDVRLVEKVRELVEHGFLRHPDVVNGANRAA